MPADVRLIESHDLKFDKSMLTGESDAIEGTVDCTDDRYVESKNIAYMTTLITQGQGNISNLMLKMDIELFLDENVLKL